MSPVHPRVGQRMTDATHHGKRREAHAGVCVTSDEGGGNTEASGLSVRLRTAGGPRGAWGSYIRGRKVRPYSQRPDGVYPQSALCNRPYRTRSGVPVLLSPRDSSSSATSPFTSTALMPAG